MKVLCDKHCVIGEGPVWNELEKKLYQVNSFADEIMEMDLLGHVVMRKLPFGVAAIAFSLLFRSIYYERVEVLASDYSYEFSVLEGANKGNFKDSAITLAGEFNYKTKIEVQVLDWGGEAVVSTSGYESELKDLTDFNKCKESGKQIVFKSKTSEGESVLIGTVPLFDEEGTFLGAYRWITSLKAVNRTTLGFTALCFVLALGVIGLFAFAGIYFMKSIGKYCKENCYG